MSDHAFYGFFRFANYAIHGFVWNIEMFQKLVQVSDHKCYNDAHCDCREAYLRQLI